MGDLSHSSGGGDHVGDPLNGATTTNKTTTTSRSQSDNSYVPTHTQRPDMGYDRSKSWTPFWHAHPTTYMVPLADGANAILWGLCNR